MNTSSSLMAVLNGETGYEGGKRRAGRRNGGDGGSSSSSSSKRKRGSSSYDGDESDEDADDESEDDHGKGKGKGKGSSKEKMKTRRSRPKFRHGNGVSPGWRKLGSKDKVYRPYREAQAFVASLRLNSPSEWRHYCRTGKKPIDVPSKPAGVYLHRGWKSFAAWLGVKPPPLPRGTKTFSMARGYARSLMLKDRKEWERFCSGKNCPDSLPKEPWKTYALRGWNGLCDFLGTKKVDKNRRK